MKNKPVERLLGSGLKAEYFNDDALGRALDKISEHDPTRITAHVFIPIAKEIGQLGSIRRLDSTTFSVEGKYEGFEDSKETPQIIKLTQGFSKKHRPDLNQAILSLVTSGKAGLPTWFEALDGNKSDKKSFHETIERVNEFEKQLLEAPPVKLWIADSALYSEKDLLQKDDAIKFLWITRVPETLKESKKLVSLPENEIPWRILDSNYKIHSQTSHYGGVEQRWLLIFSQEAHDREIKTFERSVKSEKETMEKALWHLSNEEFACEPDAEKRFKEVTKKFAWHKAIPEYTIEKRFSGKGRPKKGEVGDKTVVKIKSVVTENEEAIEKMKESKGRFILATNNLDKMDLSDETILFEYKDLQKNERGFKMLKDPWFLADKIFLKTPNRIAALMAVMTLCLFVYNYGEYNLRESLKQNNSTLPNQLKKEIQTPTLRWVFQMMEGTSVVNYTLSGTIHNEVVNMTPLKQRIVRQFGEKAKEIYGIF